MTNTQNTLAAFQNKEQIQNFVADGWTVIWVDVDTQADFAREWWSLYVATSPEVITNIESLSQSLRTKIWSVDSHAFDAWEFQDNWWPFPAHCIKWTQGWKKIWESWSPKTRFIPMSRWNIVIWESKPWEWNRDYWPEEFAQEVVNKWVTWIFEKEVYSLFANPNADPFVAELVKTAWWINKVLFAVYGYCSWDYCVDAAAKWLAERWYNTAIIEDATAPLDISQSWEQQNWVEVTRALARENAIALLQTSLFA